MVKDLQCNIQMRQKLLYSLGCCRMVSKYRRRNREVEGKSIKVKSLFYRKCHLIEIAYRGSQIHLEKDIKENIQKTEILCDHQF